MTAVPEDGGDGRNRDRVGRAAGGLVVLLLIDLLVLHRGAHVISMRDGAWSAAGFIAIRLAVILIIIGAKFMLTEIVHIGVGISLGTIVGV